MVHDSQAKSMKAKVANFCVITMLVGCASQPNRAETESAHSLVPSQLAHGGDEYEQEEVLVRGHLSIEPDSICLIDPQYASDEDPPRESMLSVLGLEKLRPDFQAFDGKVIEFRAKFKSYAIADDQFLLNGCGRRGVEIELEQQPRVVPLHSR